MAKLDAHPSSENEFLATLMVLLASIGFGLVPLFARELTAIGLASSAIAFIRYGMVAILLLPFLNLTGPKRSATLYAIGAGAAMGLGWIGYLEAVKVASVAAAGVIYMSYPLFALLFAWLLLGQRPSPRALFAGSLIVAAAALALNPTVLGKQAIGALLLSLSAPMTFGLGIAILTGKLWVLAPLERMAGATLGGTVGLVPILASLAWEQLFPTTLVGWGWIGAFILLSALLPQLLYVIAAPKVGAGRAAVAGSIELPTMFLLGWFAFGEAIGPAEVMAGLLVLLAIPLTPTIRANS